MAKLRKLIAHTPEGDIWREETAEETLIRELQQAGSKLTPAEIVNTAKLYIGLNGAGVFLKSPRKLQNPNENKNTGEK